MVAIGGGGGGGGGAGGSSVSWLVVDSAPLVAVLDDCISGPPTAIAAGVLTGALAGALGAAGTITAGVEMDSGDGMALSKVDVDAGAGAGVGIGLVEVGVVVVGIVEVEVEEIDVKIDVEVDEEEVDVEMEETGVAEVTTDDTALADLGTAVHLTPLIEVIENPAGRFALVDIL